MTTLNANPNGRTRKSLAEQIDRLDGILDGLSEGLNEAVAGAVREAVGLAVQEAVRGLLTELLANPGLLDQLRVSLGVTAPAAPATAVPVVAVAPEASPAAARVAQARAWLGAGWTKARGACAVVAGGAGQTLAAVRQRWRLTRQFRVPVLAAVAVGLVLGTVAFCGGPYVAAVAGWLAGFTTTLAAHAGVWLRRTFGYPEGALTPPETTW